ncbi:DNA-binding protein RHL1-like isoform X2 [Phragmites australis]|uniref:DNA-binding protein RHL1-like isoform X2 n=1 Tax=Phragmites australis TaxID=29695 RepID=UPI002D78400A|nr:DNA-binding protein RHL1-like isoform X2 [Phragmites australis]
MVKKPTAPADAEAGERRRLRSLAFSNGLLQRGEPAAPRSALAPSGAAARLQGRDIVRRGGQRKSRFLFSFPGLLAPAASAGRVGELADLGTKNPVLYLEFPQGRMKLFGTHVYPKNKYLTLQMTRSAKGVVCEDVFESLIVFSEAWWVGTKEENPEELKLEFPKEFHNVSEGAAADCDFRGGAGAAIDEATVNKPGKENEEPHSPKFESDADVSEDSDHKDENGTQTTSETPSVRQSARTAGKALKYTELSSGGDSSDSDNEIEVPEDLDEKMTSPGVKNESQSEDIKPADSTARSLSSKKEPLAQATLSSMFKKAEEKKRSTRSPKGSPATKGPAAKKQRAGPKEKQPAGNNKATGMRKKQKTKVEEDEIEELSSSSQPATWLWCMICQVQC